MNEKGEIMEFEKFKHLLQEHVEELLKDQSHLFVIDVDKDVLWNTYLDSFPEGTNEIFRKRRYYDCSCCRHFIKSFGNVVVIKDNKIKTIWDFKTGETVTLPVYQPVLTALSKFVKSHPVTDVFVTKESQFGTDKSYEKKEGSAVLTWDHFYVKLPKNFIHKTSDTVPTRMGVYRDIRNVFKRSLDEISKDSIDTVLELIAQKSLYKGEEWENVLSKFLTLHKEYHKLSAKEKENYCWVKSMEVGGVIGKIKNHSIGTLLMDVSNGVDLDEAVRKYESIVAPTNYKRPKAIFTKKMLEEAQKKIEELGLMDSLGRRYATLDDITINNILFANKDVAKKMTTNIMNVFDEMKKDVEVVNPKQLSKVEEVPIETFVENILPTATKIEVLLENKHIPNLVSLIAPKVGGCKTLFKWNNNFSWAYKGNITDSSMKERVKLAGGNVEGILRFSLQWNENEDNQNDYDAHCFEPGSKSKADRYYRNSEAGHIFFPNKGRSHPSSGMLDVDIIHPARTQVAIENISYTDVNKMKEGVYSFNVHCYSHRGGRSGFNAEIEFDGQIFSFNYPNDIRQDEFVEVAEVEYTHKEGFKIVKSLPSSFSSRDVWGLKTNAFHPVSVCMFSPNYWDKQKSNGHKHYLFMLNGCKNEESPNGFFNEFLKEDFMPHKRVFEALGSKMRVEETDKQLSGIGFSSTKHSEVICKVEGAFNRMIKLVF